jgi:hypothetical protein
MKKMLLLTLVLTLSIFSVTSAASSTIKLKAHIPFAFYVGSAELPAGEYIFSLREIAPHSASASALAVLRKDGTIITWLPTLPGSDCRTMEDRLQFNKYGNKYFLSKVESWGSQANLRVTGAERELRTKGNSLQGPTLLAMK